MPDVICDTSPLQYLHQIGLLHILPALVRRVLIPPAVLQEIEAGKLVGIDLPDLRAFEWLTVRSPAGRAILLPDQNLGPGETDVLMLAAEFDEAVLILDDGLARRAADRLNISVIGTLGLLINAKRAGLVSTVREHINYLQVKGFRVSPLTRAAVLSIVGEAE
ncbi:MAG: DUF3368 domain-containing protein [Nitrospira sp.]|nr:DUF3368 domain-containing protein [Nitrospira sp.]